MVRPRLAALGFALAASFAMPPNAVAAGPASSDELQQVRDELAQMRQAYEARLQAMEKRLLELQSAAAPPAVDPTPPPIPMGAAPPAQPAAGAGNATAFNPAISLILNGSYANLSRDPSTYRLQGFLPSGGDVGPGRRGFSLGESELSLSANIDPTFSGRLVFSLTGDDSVSVEEAVFERQGVLPGASLKGGRFLSSVGYLNSQHAHAWDFIDAPLAYQAFFGGPLKTDGLQLRWLAPSERFIELGAEIGAGNTFPGNRTGRNGIGSSALFAHVGDDIGDSASWRAGASLLSQRSKDRAYDDTDGAGQPVRDAFSGTSRTLLLDAVFKWAPGGNATRQNVKVQGEYFRRRESGQLGFALDSAAPLLGDYRSTQSGWYLQAVAQFMPMWRIGARYDRLGSGTPRIGLVADNTLALGDFPILASFKPSRSSLMVDYSLSEFSRFRLQLAADRSSPDGTDRQVFLQYIMSLGAHGAHTF
jgi:hypothetical protein